MLKAATKCKRCKMIANRVYRHINSRNMAIEVIDAVETSRGTHVIKYIWLNLAYKGTPWFTTGEIEHLELQPHEAVEWQDITALGAHR